MGSSEKKPLYVQLADRLRNRIMNEEYKYGQVFPPERELERIYGIDRKTVRKSLNILEKEGLLFRIQGKGTYVNRPDISYSLQKVSGFSRLLRQQGVRITNRVLIKTGQAAGYRIAKVMGIHKSDPVWKLVRLRLADEEPISLEFTYIRQELIPDFECIDFEVYSLYDAWSKSHHVPTYIDGTIDAVEVSGMEARCLGKEDGSRVFLVTDVTRDQDGLVIEYNRAYTNSDRIRLSTQLS